MRAVVVVVVLPLFQFVGEQVGVVDDLALEESVELFGVDSDHVQSCRSLRVRRPDCQQPPSVLDHGAHSVSH